MKTYLYSSRRAATAACLAAHRPNRWPQHSARIFFIAFWLLAGLAKAQNLSLLIQSKSENVNSSASGSKVAVDASGNTYVTGSFRGSVTFGTTTLASPASSDIYLVKYDNTGAFQWAKQVGGSLIENSGIVSYYDDGGTAIAVSGNDVYITGYFEGTANFNPPSVTSSNTVTAAALGSPDIFLAKYDQNGNFKWVKRAGASSRDFPSALAVSGNDVYITGEFMGTANFNTPSDISSNTITAAAGSFPMGPETDIFLAKYDDTGAFKWARRAGGPESDAGADIAVSGNDVYITGHIEGTANFNNPSATGSNEITSAGSHDIFLAKYDNNGAFKWAKRAGGTNVDQVTSMLLVDSETLYITGYFNNTTNFSSDGNSAPLTSRGGLDIFFGKVSLETGNFLWYQRAGGTGDDFSGDMVMANGDLYMTGGFDGTAYFKSATDSIGVTSAGKRDMFLAQYDLGTESFKSVKRGGGTELDGGNGLTAFRNEVYLLGYFKGTANFNTPSAFGSNELQNSFNSDVFLARYDDGKPIVHATGSLTPFSACTGVASAEQRITVSGRNLTSDLTVDVPLGFEISETSGGVFSRLVRLTPINGSVAGTNIYIRMAASATGTPSGTVFIGSRGTGIANLKTIAVSGTVNAITPPTITVGSVSGVSHTATSFSIPYTATTGNPNRYSLVTGTPTAMPSFSEVTNATLLVSPISITIPTSSESNTYNFNLTVSNSSTGCVSAIVPIDLTVTAPTITITGSLSAFLACAGSASAQQSFTVSGSNLTANITITAPTGFAVSSDGSSFGSSVTLTRNNGSVAGTPVYVRMTASATGTPSGNITCVSTGATTRNVTVGGTVSTLPPPTITLGSIGWANTTATGFSIPITATTGSPDRYSLVAGTPTAMPSFAAVSNAPLPTSLISVTIPASAVNTYNFNLTVSKSSTGCVSAAVPVTLTVVSGPTPNITITGGTLSAFSTCTGVASPPQSFTISGSNLAANITVTAPTGFEVSSDGSSFGASVTLTRNNGSVAGTPVYVRTTASATGTLSGNVTCVSTGATTQIVAVGGTVNAITPPTITLSSVSWVNTTATGFSIPYTTTTGSPDRYSLVAGTPTAMPSFSAVTNAALPTSPISVTIPASPANTYNFNLTVSNSSTGCASAVVPVALTVISGPTPNITTTGSLEAFSACTGGVSAQQSFTASGSNLAADIIITAPTGFEVSSDGSSFGASVTLTRNNGSVAGTLVYVRMSASATGTPSGNVTCASTGATTQNVAAGGTVSPLTPPTITLGSVNWVNTTATSFSIPYTTTTGSPDRYSLVAGTPTAMPSFSAVTNAPLPASPISVTIPASAVNTYNFNLTVSNSSTGCVSAAMPVTLAVTGGAAPAIHPNLLIKATSTSSTFFSDNYSRGYSTAIDASGNTYVVGSFVGSVTFGTTTLVNPGAPNSGTFDIYLAKYDHTGTFQWAKRAGGTGLDQANGVAVSGNDVYITGSFMGTANFNTPSATGSNEITSAGNTDIFLAKYDATGAFQWAKRAGGAAGYDSGNGVAVSGNEVYITGYFQGTANFNTPSSTGSNEITTAEGSFTSLDIFLAKYDHTGTFQWAKRAGGRNGDEANGVAVSGNDVYITGYFEEQANFNTPSAIGSNEITAALHSSGKGDIFLAKYDHTGTFKWARRAGAANLRDEARGVAVSGNDVYIAGSFRGTANFNTPSATGSNTITYAGDLDRPDIFLAKYDSTGNFRWAKRAGAVNAPDEARGVAVLGNDVYITGYFQGTANFNTPSATGSNEITSVTFQDPELTYASSSQDIFLAKYDSTGTFQWAERAGGTGTDQGMGVTVLGNLVYITGYFQNLADFNTPRATCNSLLSHAKGDAFLARYGTASPPTTVTPDQSSLSAFSACAGSSSQVRTFSIQICNAVGNLTVTAPDGFEVATTGIAFSPSITLNSPNNSNITISVRMVTTATGTPSGNITIASTGAVTRNVEVSGTVSFCGTLTLGTATNPTTCGGTDGSIAFTSTGYTAGSTQTVSYRRNGVTTALTQTVTIGSGGSFTLSNLTDGVYSNFAIGSTTATGIRTLTLPASCYFITRWDLSKSGSVAARIIFDVGTTGTVNYTWTQVGGTATGSGTFSGGSPATITGLPSGGTIDLSISPTNFNYFNSGTDRLLLTEIKQWGTTAWSSMETAFAGCSNMTLTATDVPNTAAVTNMRYMFDGCSSFNQALPEGFNTANVTRMGFMFRGCSAYNQPLPTSFNTAKVTDMGSMFNSCSAYNKSLPTSFNTTAVTNMEAMFEGCISFNQALPTNFNTAKVTDMSFMFNGCSAYNEPLPTNFNTAKVTTMSQMFQGCNVYNHPLPANFTTAAVTDMSSMFSGATAFNRSLAGFQLRANVNLSGFLDNSGLSVENYDATLSSFKAQAQANNITGRTMGAAGLKYCAAEADREILRRPTTSGGLGWTITDANVKLCGPAFSLGTSTNPTTCGGTGSITFTSSSIAAGNQTLTYKKDGVDATPATVTIAANGSFTLAALTAGLYSDFAIGATIATGNRRLSDPTFTLTVGTPTNATTCEGNGSIAFSTTLPAGSYTLTFKKGGANQMAPVTVNSPSQAGGTGSSTPSNSFVLSNLTAGTYSAFKIVHASCDVTAAGPVQLSGPLCVRVIYVNAANTAPAQDGNSWTTAFRSLQSGLSEAALPSTVPVEVWVANGTYKPGNTRESYFNIPSGVKVYGGFVGNESSLTQRPAAGGSILSGEISTSAHFDNTRHVAVFQNTNAGTLLDGFTITRGYADFFPTTANVNDLMSAGGGVLALDQAQGTIANCTISGNRAMAGGGIFQQGTSQVNVQQSVIWGNEATFGGGFYHLSKSSPTYTNCLIVQNKAMGGAGYNNNSTPTFMNCTIASNQGNDGTTGGIANTNQSASTFTNSIVWGNSNRQIDAGSVVTYSVVQGGYTGMGNLNTDPKFVGSVPSGLALLSALGDYRLLVCSPAINAATTTGAPAVDIAGGARPQGAGVDMGVHEGPGVIVPPTQSVTANITSGTVLITAGTITATNQVSNANVEYRAGSSVTLLPGFQATGNTFQATIGTSGCN